MADFMTISEILQDLEKWGVNLNDKAANDKWKAKITRHIDMLSQNYLPGDEKKEYIENLKNNIIKGKGRAGNKYPSQLVSELFFNHNFQEAIHKDIQKYEGDPRQQIAFYKELANTNEKKADYLAHEYIETMLKLINNNITNEQAEKRLKVATAEYRNPYFMYD